MKLKLLLTFTLLLALICSTQSLLAQGVTTGNLKGKILDASKTPLVGATIKVINTNTGSQQFVLSNESGIYRVNGMKIGGAYSVNVSYVGYQEIKINDVTINLGQDTQLDIILKDDKTTLQTVEVVAAKSNLLSRTSTDVIISKKELQSLPTLNRSIADFSRLMPESTPTGFMGQSNKNNFVTVDGASFNNSFGLGGDNLLPGNNLNVQPISLDALEQVQVNSSPWDVRQGGFTGAGINTVTRSGDNKVRASVYSYFQNSSLVGDKVNGVDAPINSFNQNISGLRIGGPLVKNKLFYFVSYESTRITTPAVSFVAGQSGNTGTNVSNIMASQLDILSGYLQKTYNYNPGGYQDYNKVTKGDNFLVKLNWNINDNHQFTVRYSTMMASNSNNDVSLGKNNSTFQDVGWTRKAKINAFVVELNSKLNSKLNNRFFTSYTLFPETRQPSNAAIAPWTQINDNGLSYQFGTHPAAYGNKISQNTLQIQNDITASLNKHSLTAGISYQNFDFSNTFTLFNNGYYVFNSLANFYNNSPAGTTTPIGSSTGLGLPTQLTINYPIDASKIATSVNPKFAQTGFYIYDEFSPSTYLKITGGIRFDLTTLINKPAENTALNGLIFQNENGQSTSISTSSAPSNKLLFSPRIGFSYDALHNGRLNIKGGSGLFTGKVPFVFIEKAYSNSGVVEGTVATAGQLGSFPWTTDINKYLPTNRQARSSFLLATIDPNYRMPQVWRSSIGLDYKVIKNLVLSADYTYSKDLSAPFIYNTNLDAKTISTDATGRMIFGKNRINSNISGTHVLTYKEMGDASYFTVKLTKLMAKNWFATIGYSVGVAKNISDLNQTTPESAYNRTPIVNNGNIPVLSNSLYNVPSNLTGGASYILNSKLGQTTISAFFQGSSLGRYSYIANLDLNKDGGIGNDLIFVPSNANDLTFDDSKMSKEEQWKALDAFISNDPYLKNRRGQFAERNGATLPHYFKVDSKIIHELNIGKGENKHGFQISLDMFNVGNLLNSKWGVLQTAATNTPITYLSSGKVTVNPTVLANNFVPVTSIASRWQMQIGLRYLFN